MSALQKTPCNTSRPKSRLLLFCSHPLAQEQFAHLLKRSEFDVVVSREMRLPAVESPAQASVAVIDASNATATVEFVRVLRMQQWAVNVLVLLLPSFEDSITFRLLRLGVKGLLTYAQVQHELCRAARQVSAGGYWMPRDLLTRFVESILPELRGCKLLDTEAGVSRREREVLDLLLDNLSNKEIAAKLFVCERTVKFHVSHLLSKFGVQRRADLIVLWMQRSNAFPHQPRDLEKSMSMRVN
jgi:DNA-binding NarL/FixJ family response regulator